MARVAAQVSAGGHRACLRAARRRRPRCLRGQPRRFALRWPAPARRYRARGDAAAGGAARRRADLLARPEDLRRNHAAPRRHRSRSRDSGRHQHARRRARQTLCRSRHRHVGRERDFRRSARRSVGCHAQNDLRGRGLAPMTRAGVMTSAATALPFRSRTWARVGWLALAAYVVYACAQLDVSAERIASGLSNAAHFFGRMFPPNFARWDLLVKGLKESLEIAMLASALGIALSLPIGLVAALNLMSSRCSWPARRVIVAARSFHPVIVAILFVKAVGFGALAGILALTVASIGFIGKLFAEAIEEISLKQVEAVRATGASFMGIVAIAVLPQVFARFIGFCTYQLDSNLRNSTMVGIVGAGGIGGTLFAAFQRFDYDYVCAILISIIALIMIGEMVATYVRAIFIDGMTFAEMFHRRLSA